MNDHLAGHYAKCGVRFVPLVNNYFQLVCSLDILFLRREAPGDVVHGGDLDNRLKVLFDGLRMPAGCEELAGDVPKGGDDPFYCLLEDDALIAGLRVTTDRLLTAADADEGKADVHLVITVTTNSVKPGSIP